MRKYHFTYDISQSENYDEDKEFLLYLFHLTNYESIECNTKSTLILTYNDEFPSSKLFNFLSNNLPDNIFYSISKIPQYNNNKKNFIISENKDKELNKNFQKELETMNFDVLKIIYDWNIERF
ncbi:hypothetical protein [Chryseobacterium gambrini]|uniref:Uncharacterized protein n=1 Tax=Chryseobacterium gambrini TaxID=373672 RepID=A0A1N7KBL6_9FLAO|nr:hypothetical protein [Chryseobacterium gambrini]SIS58900.1 hypothetical protein SAMN05421785_101380 [Chryseobacterium gambrini]